MSSFSWQIPLSEYLFGLAVSSKRKEEKYNGLSNILEIKLGGGPCVGIGPYRGT